MQKPAKLLKMTALLAVSGLILGGCQATNQPFYGAKTNHFASKSHKIGQYPAALNRFKAPKNKFKAPKRAFNSPYNQFGHTPYKKALTIPLQAQVQ